MANFTVDGKNLFIDGQKVIRGWESYNGWFWFAIERRGDAFSDLATYITMENTVYFGFVQGFIEEWGYFSLSEIECLKICVWEISKEQLPFAGRR
jgi:hypothetical protein